MAIELIGFSKQIPLGDQVSEVIEAYFDFGSITKIEQLFGGCTNLSFSVTTKRNGKQLKHFLRKYRKGVSLDTITFEHALIDHIIAGDTRIIAGLVRGKDGRGYVRTVEEEASGLQEYFYAAFDFIGGQDKYFWFQNNLTSQEYVSSGAALAELHSATLDFDAGALGRPRESIQEVLDNLGNSLEDCVARAADTIFDRCFLQNLSCVLGVVECARCDLTDLSRAPKIGIHGDFHPGNQKYFANRVVGVFDFDRADFDFRLFDVAFAVIYFCVSWDDGKDGRLLLDRCALFLRAYQQRTGEIGRMEPLTPMELEHFPSMLAAANLVLLKWSTIESYYAGSEKCDANEYLCYLRHCTRLMRWIEENRKNIVRMLKTL